MQKRQLNLLKSKSINEELQHLLIGGNDIDEPVDKDKTRPPTVDDDDVVIED